MKNGRKLKLVSTKVVRALHGQLLVDHGGKPGVRDEVLLSVMGTARDVRDGRQRALPLVRLAATYFYTFARSKPFASGNSAMAWLVARLCVASNGQTLLPASAREIVDMLRGVEDGAVPFEIVVKWFREMRHRAVKVRLKDRRELRARELQREIRADYAAGRDADRKPSMLRDARKLPRPTAVA